MEYYLLKQSNAPTQVDIQHYYDVVDHQYIAILINGVNECFFHLIMAQYNNYSEIWNTDST